MFYSFSGFPHLRSQMKKKIEAKKWIFWVFHNLINLWKISEQKYFHIKIIEKAKKQTEEGGGRRGTTS